MPKVTDEYKATKRNEIAGAALRVFGRKGFHGTSMADIIAESGQSAGAIYSHFSGKEEIIHAVARTISSEAAIDTQRLATSKNPPTPGELVEVFVSRMTAALDSPAVLVQLWGECVIDPSLSTLIETVVGRLHASWADYVSQWHQRKHGLDAAAADALGREQAPIFVGACQSWILHSALVPSFDSKAYFVAVAKYLPS